MNLDIKIMKNFVVFYNYPQLVYVWFKIRRNTLFRLISGYLYTQLFI